MSLNKYVFILSANLDSIDKLDTIRVRMVICKFLVIIIILFLGHKKICIMIIFLVTLLYSNYSFINK